MQCSLICSVGSMCLVLLFGSADIHAGTSGQGTGARGSNGPDLRPGGDRLIGSLIVHDGRDSNDSLAAPIELTAFRGALADGRVWTALAGWREVELHAGDLVGLRWSESLCSGPSSCTDITYRIVDAHLDRSRNTMRGYGDNSDVWLYEVEYAVASNPGARDWKNVCSLVSGDDRTGLFVNGRWNEDGSWNPAGYTFACASGVIAKCVRSWGYKPWKELVTEAGQTVDLRPLHRACVRAARADYCGDGVSYTNDGIRIDMADVYGLNDRDLDTGFRREAGFSEKGAAWVAHARGSRGGELRGPVVVFPTCLRPRYVPGVTGSTGSQDERVLIHVWSEPLSSNRSKL